jgi:hypothetical protein
MGILDKAKDTLSKATESARDKLDDVIDRRKADELLDALGRVVYRQRTGRGSAEDEADIARLVAELQALEAEGTEIDDTEVPEQ